jgi:hypothetical protein
MHFPKFWTLARKGGVFAWGWSDNSVADAEADGLKRVDRIIEWLRNDMPFERGAYGYPDRPMREEVLREFHNAAGQRTAVVSRNSYGCLVLNTERMLFVDVDERNPGFLNALASLFGGGGFEKRVLVEVEKWLAVYPEWGWRVYRTRAGIRLLATHATLSPEDPVCAKAFKKFRADWLYQKLCVNQKCFRARITPKPWRCGVEKPKIRWPYPDEQAVTQFREWSHRYEKGMEGHAVCRLLGHFGNKRVHGELLDLISFHDGATRVDTSFPLA